MEGKNPNMIDDEEKELSKRVTILTEPRKINITQVLTIERKSYFVYKSSMYKEKAQNKVVKFRRRRRGKKQFPRQYCIYVRQVIL